MQYYINLSIANNFSKLKLSERAKQRPKMVTGEQIIGENKQNKIKKSDKCVKFSADIPQISIDENMIANNNSSTTTLTNGLNDMQSSTPNAQDDSVARQFDLVIFAASSCVGKFLVEEMALVVEKQFNKPSNQSTATSQQQQQQFAQQALRRRSVPSSSTSDTHISWALAGRSAMRLSETLCRAELSTGIKDLSSSIPIILADLNHQKSLLEMCKKTKLVINCAGPYSELGAEILIQACIESRTNYIDLAHEVTFVELMRQKYSQRARDAEVFILNGCGFQSMSAEMGLNFTKQVADGTIEQIKIILSLSDTSALIKSPSRKQRASGIISEGMWSSLLAEKAQEISVEDRLRTSAAMREQEAYQLMQEQQIEQEERERLLAATSERKDGRNKQQQQIASSSQAQPSTSTGVISANLIDNISNQTKTLTARILKRKDTQALVKDLMQFRNRRVSIAWPLRLIQGFQGKSGRGYCWPIDNMSSDESQLIRGEMNNYELRRPDLDCDEGWRPIRCSTFLSVRNFTQLSLLFVWLFIFQLLVKFSLFRYFMRKCPQLITLGHVVSNSSSSTTSALLTTGGVGSGGSGSSLLESGGQQAIERDSLSHIKFCQTFIAYGMPSDDSCDPLEERRDKHAARKQVQLLVSRVVGPEPNHVATATFAIQAAMTLLAERDHLPCAGGVLTPGAAFSETNIIYQLRKRNIKFEVLKKA